MKERSRSVSRIAAPIKGLAYRFAYITFFLSAVALLMLGKVDTTMVERTRAQTMDALAPILDVASRPVDSAHALVDEVKELHAIRAENVRLHEQTERLLHWQAAARRLEVENKELRGLLNFVPDMDPGFITARVIGDSGGIFANSLVLNAGERQGVRKGQAAISGEGLVGRVVGVGARSSRLLLIGDINSRIPVVTQPGGVRAILAGNNTDFPRLIHLAPGATVEPGERIVTSGHGGAFPYGLPVGVVAVTGDKGITIQPYVERNRLQYVRILDYGLTGIVETPPVREAPGKDARPSSGSRSP